MVAPNVVKTDDSTTQDAFRQNIMGILRNTGTYLNTLDKEEFTLVVANDTSAGYIKDHVYLFAADGTTKIDLTAIQEHYHIDIDSGGYVTGIFGFNKAFHILDLTTFSARRKADWSQGTSGTGIITDTTVLAQAGIQLDTGVTSGSLSRIKHSGLQGSWATDWFFGAKIELTDVTSLALHIGVDPDDVTSADSNTRKVNAEICTATNRNWFLRTADGTNKSASDSGIDAGASGNYGIAIDFFSGVNANLYISTNTVFSKSSFIPSGSSSITDNNQVHFSIKNSIGASRLLNFGGARMYYKVRDEWVN